MNLRFTLLNSLRVSVLFSCSLPLAVIAQTNAVQPIHNVVLVHGAWADGSSGPGRPLLERKVFTSSVFRIR